MSDTVLGYSLLGNTQPLTERTMPRRASFPKAFLSIPKIPDAKSEYGPIFAAWNPPVRKGLKHAGRDE